MNIYIPSTMQQIEAASIKELIVADIHLKMICAKLDSYDYDMSHIKENLALVDDELQKKLKAENRRKLQNLEARRQALLPNDVLLKNIDDEIKSLKKKLEE